MNSFIYNIPTKVYFGENQLGNLGKELTKFGKRVLLTYGGGSIKRSGLYDRVIAELRGAGMEIFELSGIEPNPRIDSVREGVKICKEQSIDVLLAVGGGSTIDATKFMAAGACVEHDAWEFFGANAKPIDTGGVISNLETGDKLGRLAQPLLPKVSFLDPTLTYSVSKYQTACGAADIMSHIIEVYFNTQDDLFMLDCFMEGLLKTVVKFAPVALTEPENYEARANLMWSSSWAINGFINGGKRKAWSCHPMEHELSAVYDITHGLGLAILTPRWMEYCLDETTVDKYVQYGVNVFGIDHKQDKMTIAKESIRLTAEFLYEKLGLQRTFTEVGIKREDFNLMAEKACRYGDIKGFKTLTKEDVVKIFEMCL